jgi:hypothetical protein
MTRRPPVEELLQRPDAYLLKGDLYALGLGRRAVDAVIDAIGRQVPGYSRPVVLVRDWHEYKERFTFRGDRPRPARTSQT